MSELGRHYAYFFVLGGMALVAATMLAFFYFKGWFR